VISVNCLAVVESVDGVLMLCFDWLSARWSKL